MAFTEHEKGRVLHHLGYPSFQSLSNGIQLGFPAASQPLFLVEQSFKRLSPAGEASVREDLCQCDDIESQMSSARARLKTTEVGGVKLNGREIVQLRGELVYWRTKLADDLGCSFNPHSNAAIGGTGGGINSGTIG